MAPGECGVKTNNLQHVRNTIDWGLLVKYQDSPLVAPAKRIVGGDLKFPCGQEEAPEINWTKTSAAVGIPSAPTIDGWALIGESFYK